VVELGEAAEVLKEEKRLFMMLPDGKSQNYTEEKSKRPKIGKANPKPVLTQGKDQEPKDFDQALFSRLRELRKEIAGQEGLPVFVVFPDASLRDMCWKKPVSLVQFSSVHGVGSIKLEKYGDAFTSLIRGYLEKVGI
jgi:ATP-dependent DNA helicase RecQ